MEWLHDLIFTPSVASALFILALVIALGLTLRHINIGTVSLGVTWILFVGIAAGQFGLSIPPDISHFVKEFGLILFIYSVGIEVGPTFFSSYRSGGITLNILAATIVLLGSGLAVLFWHLTGDDPVAMTGVLYGAVTNTPGLGAAQQTYSELHGSVTNPLFAQGYAVAYPLGVIGIILSITVLRALFKVDLRREQEIYERNAHRNGIDLQRRIAEKRPAQREQPNLFFIFIGIALGVLLGSTPIGVPGMTVPVKLGLAGGPLVVSILLAYFGPRIHIATYVSVSANMMIRQIGISLFMAAVGLGAGQGFVQTVLNGGYWWVLWGFVITIVPCLLVGAIARWGCKLSFFTIAGLISGATTDPPALAYSNSLCGGSQASVAYTTVYPLSMFLRVAVAQLLVIFAF